MTNENSLKRKTAYTGSLESKALSQLWIQISHSDCVSEKHFTAVTPTMVYTYRREFPWEELFHDELKISIDTIAFVNLRQNFYLNTRNEGVVKSIKKICMRGK